MILKKYIFTCYVMLRAGDVLTSNPLLGWIAMLKCS